MMAGVMPEKMEYVLDGACFSTLEEFAAHFSERVLPDYQWRGNLDAFKDILGGGFGTPESGFVLVWRNAQTSKERLGYPETVRQLEARLSQCHPENVEAMSQDLERARRRSGPTVFDWLVDIIRDHGPDGAELDDGINLELR